MLYPLSYSKYNLGCIELTNIYAVGTAKKFLNNEEKIKTDSLKLYVTFISLRAKNPRNFYIRVDDYLENKYGDIIPVEIFLWKDPTSKSGITGMVINKNAYNDIQYYSEQAYQKVELLIEKGRKK